MLSPKTGIPAKQITLPVSVSVSAEHVLLRHAAAEGEEEGWEGNGERGGKGEEGIKGGKGRGEVRMSQCTIVPVLNLYLLFVRHKNYPEG